MSDFKTVFFDDFNGNALDRGTWKALYSGQHGNGMFRWDPSQLEVADGKLTIATEREGGGWASGGLSTIPDGQTYGRYEFRARVDEAQGTSGVVLLWPSNNQWTDEVNILETHDPRRDSFAFVNHGNPWVTEYIPLNVDGWHDYRLDWTPGQLVLSVDGRERARITHDVPDQKMSFGMQAQVHAPWEGWFGGGPNGGTPSRAEMEIDWVRVSAWTPGQGDAAPTGFAAAAAGGTDWMAAAQRYVARDGAWDGSWRNQVASGQITIEDVASRLAAGQGQWELWQ